MTEVLPKLASVFLASAIVPTVPFFPIRPTFLIPLVSITVSPVLVAVTGTIGAALGTLPLYAVTAKVKDYRSVRRWLRYPWVVRILTFLRGRLFLAFFLIALLPIPDQFVSLIGGVEAYPASRMLIALFLGRLPYFLLLAYLGVWNRDSLEAIRQGFFEFLGV